MKKLISTVITFCLIMTSAAVFAEEAAGDNTSTPAVTQTEQTSGKTDTAKIDKSKKQEIKAKKAELKEQAKAQKDAAKAEREVIKDKIKANRETIKGLKEQVRELHKKAKARIKEIVKDKENLTQETVDELKDMLAQLREDRSSMCETFGKIKEDALDIGLAKKNQNTEKIKEGLNHVLEVQKDRIEKLKAIIAVLNKIAEYKAE